MIKRGKMKEKELGFILQEGEGLKIEFKESINEISKEIVAFANSEGGRIFLGVSDIREVKGITITNKLKSQIQDIARNCDPSIDIKLEKFKNVLIVHVKEGVDKPYKCSSGFYLRQGPNSQKMTRDEVINLSVKIGKIRFDEQINNYFVYPDDFDESRLNYYLDLAKISKIISNEKILVDLNIAKKKKILNFNNAGVLFFAKEPQKFISHSVFTCVSFKNKEGSDIIDRQEITGNLIEIIEEVMKFANKNIKVAYKFTGKPQRENVYEYSLEAIREAVINSVVHRDYSETGHNNILKIFPDKISIVNVWIKPEGFKLGKDVFRRNKIIADLFSRVRLIEKVGSGFARMKNYCKKVNAPPFKLDVDEKYFRIEFFKSKDYLNLTRAEGKVDARLMQFDEKLINRWLTKVNARLTQELSYSEKKIIYIMIKSKKINSSDCQKMLKISRVMANRYFKKLIGKGIIVRKGIGKSTYYILNKEKEARWMKKLNA